MHFPCRPVNYTSQIMSVSVSGFAVTGVGQNSYSGTSVDGTVNERFSTTLTSLAVVSYKILVSFVVKLLSLLK